MWQLNRAINDFFCGAKQALRTAFRFADFALTLLTFKYKSAVNQTLFDHPLYKAAKLNTINNTLNGAKNNKKSDGAQDIILVNYHHENQIDHDWQTTAKTTSLPNSQALLAVVIHKNNLCLMKIHQQYDALMREACALHRLRHLGQIARLIDIDVKTKKIYQTYIPGSNLERVLLKSGLTPHQIYLYENLKTSDPQYPRDFYHKYRRHLADQSFVDNLRVLILAIHKAGILIGEVKFSNIIRYHNLPFIINFENSKQVFSHNPNHQLLIWQENARFNRLLPLELPTWSNHDGTSMMG